MRFGNADPVRGRQGCRARSRPSETIDGLSHDIVETWELEGVTIAETTSRTGAA